MKATKLVALTVNYIFKKGPKVKEILTDEIVAFADKRFRYTNEWHESHGSIPYGEGMVSISQVDDSGKEGGLYVRNHYYNTNQACDESGFTEIGMKKDGKIHGALYGFRDGKLVQVTVADKIIDSEDRAFSAYKNLAPKFKEAFKLLKNAESSVDKKHSGNFWKNLRNNGIFK